MNFISINFIFSIDSEYIVFIIFWPLLLSDFIEVNCWSKSTLWPWLLTFFYQITLYLNTIHADIFTMWEYVYVFFYVGDVRAHKCLIGEKRNNLILALDFYLLKGVQDALWLGNDSCFENILISEIHLRKYMSWDSMRPMDFCDRVSSFQVFDENQMVTITR